MSDEVVAPSDSPVVSDAALAVVVPADAHAAAPVAAAPVAAAPAADVPADAPSNAPAGCVGPQGPVGPGGCMGDPSPGDPVPQGATGPTGPTEGCCPQGATSEPEDEKMPPEEFAVEYLTASIAVLTDTIFDLVSAVDKLHRQIKKLRKKKSKK